MVWSAFNTSGNRSHISAGGTASERPPKGTVVKSGHMFLGGIGLLAAVILTFLWLPVESQTTTLDDLNVIWDSLSTDSWGSMPIGNGDIIPNVWLPVSLPSHTSWFC